MQNPWVIGLVALVLAAMAASMFGAFELQLPSAWQARLSGVGGAGRAGAFGMGLVSGVIAAPCTGPVLAAALAFVAAKGSVAFGFGIMFVYALGIGLLFFLIGAFSISLPKSGPWMDAVKSRLRRRAPRGGRRVPEGRLPRPEAALQRRALGGPRGGGGGRGGRAARRAPRELRRRGAPRRLAKAAGVLLLVGGVVYAAGAAGARDRRRSAEGFAWLADEAQALALAAREGRPVIIDFWAEWCAACKELDRTAWADPRVREEAGRFVAVKLDGTDGSDAFQALTEKYGIVGMPTVVFIDPRGREVPERVTAAIGAERMVETLRGVDRACEQPAAERRGAHPLAPAAPGPAVVACAARW